MSLARFHFDPTHDREAAPTPDAVRAWVLERMETPGSYVQIGVDTVERLLLTRPGPRRILASLLPGGLQRRRGRMRKRCLDAATTAAITTRDMMVEFGVDLTSHPSHSNTLEAIAALGILSINEGDTRRFVDNARANWDSLHTEIDKLDSMLDYMDTEMRIAEYSAGIRSNLEAEALGHLAMEEDSALDRPMRIAALKAAVDELRQVDLRSAVISLLNRIEK